MSSQQPPEYTEEELRALEAEMERVTVDDVLLQTLVSLLNLAARKGGLATAPGDPAPEPDWEQLRQGIEGARALIPLLEPRHAQQLGPIRDALSRLQVHYAQNAPGGGASPADGPQAPAPAGSQPAPGAPPAGPGQPPRPGQPEPPSRLWIPGR